MQRPQLGKRVGCGRSSAWMPIQHCQTYNGNIGKVLNLPELTCSYQKHFSTQNAPNSVWRPGSARTRLGSLSAPQTPLAAIWGLLPRGEEGKEEGRRGNKNRNKDVKHLYLRWRSVLKYKRKLIVESCVLLIRLK